VICSSCGEENPDRFRLCGFCGAELPRPAALEARKVVTLVFADVTGSTALGERLDAESVRWVMSSFFEIAREVLERHGGTVEKFIGDAVMAAFGIPQVHEDDALRGVRAAAELRDRLHELGREVEVRYGTGIGVRIGVETGEVVAGDASAGQAFASGDAVNVAARLEQAAAPGQVLMGRSTYGLVRDAVTVEPVEALDLKGKGAPVPAWRLVDVLADRPGVARALGAPLVGREAELRRLLDAFADARTARDPRIATIVAHAGVGKTRLMAELIDRVQPEAEVLVGRCLAYGEGITFWPIAEALRQATHGTGDLAALLEGEAGAGEILERIAPALGLPGPPVPLEETFWAIRKLFEALARRRPLVVILDDVHWAEATLLDLVEYIAGWTRGVPFLLVCATRPELLERRPSIASPRPGSTTLVLEPLAAGASGDLLAWQLGREPMSSELGARILAASQGNPLFVQELVRMLVEDGLIERRDGSWQATGSVTALAMPPTIQALLAARLDLLEPGERAVAERGAVIGHVFSWSAVRELCPERARSDLGGHLHALVRKQLIVPQAGPDASEDAFRFGHMLVRDAAYAGLAKRTRAELHERFARWLESATSDRLTENAEILGYHLEQAVAYRRELGDLADAGRMAVQASERLAEGGRRALAAGDLPAAANLLGRAGAILDPGDPERLALRLDSVPALVEIGRFELADVALAEILAAPQQTSLQLAARAWHAFLDAQRGTSSFETCEATAEQWRAASERDGDHGGQATALGFLAKMRFWDGRAQTAEALWLRAAEQARLADDRR
jgi:class 3 adenylate cyclase